MIAYYALVKAVHVAAVLVSGLLFLARGVLVQAGRERWAQVAPVRFASYAIDTVLLTAALMLVAMLPGAVFGNHWLTVKVALVIVYIVLGVFALRRAATRRARAACLAAALAVYALVIGIALAHHPLGWLAPQ
ncbi:MAG TPA: SirB2 family protein [Burkholderiales bacterium]|nr:SirB2 family protein [Burkholderiales bacterium]